MEKSPDQAENVKQRHSCNFCHLDFAYEVSLRRHIQTRHISRPKLGKISVEFNKKTKKKNRKKVLDSDSDESLSESPSKTPSKDLFKCAECPKCFNSRAKLLDHLSAHIDTKPFACMRCVRVYEDISALTSHECEDRFGNDSSSEASSSNESPKSLKDSEAKVNLQKCHSEIIESLIQKDHSFIKTEDENDEIDNQDESNVEEVNEETTDCPDDQNLKLEYNTEDDSLNKSDKCNFYMTTFECSLCRERFDKAPAFASHCRTSHDIKLPFVCPVCKQAFRIAGLLRQHMRTTHAHFARRKRRTGSPKKNYIIASKKISSTCEICGVKLCSKKFYERHMESHSEIRPFSCNQCERSFKDDVSLEKHVRKFHTGELPFGCHVCPARFRLLHQLKCHQRQHFGDKPYKCAVCDECFRTIKHRKQHEIIMHTDVTSFKCEECPSVYSTVHALHYHRKTVHRPLLPKIDLDTKRCWQCDICGKRFSVPNNLSRHRATHSGEKPFLCDLCPAAYKDGASLLHHKRSNHLREKHYVCDICGKRFYRSNQCTIHRRTHTGERPYVCVVPECGKRFMSANTARRHRTCHMVQPPISCDICPARFMEPSALYRHLQKGTHRAVARNRIYKNYDENSNDSDLSRGYYVDKSSSANFDLDASLKGNESAILINPEITDVHSTVTLIDIPIKESDDASDSKENQVAINGIHYEEAGAFTVQIESDGTYSTLAILE